MSKELWLYFSVFLEDVTAQVETGAFLMAVGFLDLHSWIVVVGPFCVPPRLSTACNPLLVGVGFFIAVKLIPFVRLVLVTVRNRRIILILNMMKF